MSENGRTGERDPFLDALRTLGALWVLGVHVLYWTGIFPVPPYSVAKSFFLLEMPLFFFLSGAGLGLAAPEPYGRFVGKRFRRILVPYWCYALACVALDAVLRAARGGFSWAALGKTALAWVLPLGGETSSLPYVTDALWYVPAYLLCMLLFPLLARCRRYPAPVLGTLAAAVGVCGALGWYWPQTGAFYCLWLFAGLQYPALRRRYIDRRDRRWELCLAAALGTAAMLLLHRLGFGWDMQENKFPPNLQFLAFSLAAMSLLGLALPWLLRLLRRLRRSRALAWLLDRLGRYGLTVFLWQSWAFWAVRPLYLLADRQNWPGPLTCAVCFVCAAALSALLTVPLGRLEELGRKNGKEGLPHERL